MGETCSPVCWGLPASFSKIKLESMCTTKASLVAVQPSTANLENCTNMEIDETRKDSGESSTEDVCPKKSAGLLSGVAEFIGLMHSRGDHCKTGLFLGQICLGLIFWIFGGIVAWICWTVCVALGTVFKSEGCCYSYIGLQLSPVGVGFVFWMFNFIETSMGSTLHSAILEAFTFFGCDYIVFALGPLGLAFVFWVISGVVACIGSVLYVQLAIPVKRKGGNHSYINLALRAIGTGFMFWLLGGIASFISSWSYVTLVASFENASDYSYSDIGISLVGLWFNFWLLGGIVACIGLMSLKLNARFKQSCGDYSYLGLALGPICLGLVFWLLGGIAVCFGSMVYATLDIVSKQSGGDKFYVDIALGPVGMGLIFWLVGGIVSCIGWMMHEVLGIMFKYCCRRSARTRALIRLVALALVPQMKKCFTWACKWIVRPLMNAIMTLTLANYLLVPFFPGCKSQLAVVILAAIITVFVTAVTYINVAWSARLSSFTTRRTLIVLLILGLSCRLQGQGQATNRTVLPIVMPTTSNIPVPISEAAFSVPAYPAPALPFKAEHPLLRDNMTAAAVAICHSSSCTF